MDLETTISNARELAEKKRSEGLIGCADNSAQIANWLDELREYKTTGITANDIQEVVDLLSEARPNDLPAELKSWAERCTWHVRKCMELEVQITALQKEILAAKTDIAALIWLDGCCDYCKFGRKLEYSGASQWTCSLGSAAECRPEWRGKEDEKE